MKELDVAITAAKKAGEVLREYYTHTLTTQLKSDNTLVSEADLAAEKVIIATIQKTFPDHAIFSEEAGMALAKSEYLWIIDPLDGSTNFLRHVGNFGTAVALVKDNKPLVAAVFSPLTDEVFSAETGKGAHLNDQPMRISETEELQRSLISFGRGYANLDRHIQLYRTLTLQDLHTRTVRILGSAVMSACYTASGRFDAYLFSDCKLYDSIAGAIIAKESGAKVTDFSGEAWRPDFSDPTSTKDILISNPHIHSKLVEVLQSA